MVVEKKNWVQVSDPEKQCREQLHGQRAQDGAH